MRVSIPSVDPVPPADLPLLAGLAPEQVAFLLAGAEVRDHPRGELLFREGEAADRLFLLRRGAVELFAGEGRRETTVLVLRPPEPFVPAAALTDEPHLVSARTLAPVRLLALDAARVREEASRSPELAYRFTRTLAGQFRTTVRHVKNLRLRTGPERLGAFLLRLVDEAGRHGRADLPLPKGRLASRLGLSAEALSRAIRLLNEQGMTVRGSRVVLTDRAKLERFCGPDPLIDGREPPLGAAAS